MGSKRISIRSSMLVANFMLKYTILRFEDKIDDAYVK